jgi:hypothetical protein
MNAIKKPLYILKNFFKSLTKHFKGFGSGFMSFMQNLMQAHSSILSLIPNKSKHKIEKAFV